MTPAAYHPCPSKHHTPSEHIHDIPLRQGAPGRGATQCHVLQDAQRMEQLLAGKLPCSVQRSSLHWGRLQILRPLLLRCGGLPRRCISRR